MTGENPLVSRTRVVAQGYGLAALSAVVALGIANAMYYYLQVRQGQFAILLMAVAVTVWFAGKWPGILAVVLAILGFNYCFTPHRYRVAFTRADISYCMMFLVLGLGTAWFIDRRRRAELNLKQSRDELQREMATRSQQASLLNLTHDPIFVREMSGVVKYWNRGAEELYGWISEQAVGNLRTISCRRSFRDLLRKFRGSCSVPAAGRASWRKREPMEVVWWLRAGGHCSGMSVRTQSRSLRPKTTSPSETPRRDSRPEPATGEALCRAGGHQQGTRSFCVFHIS